MNTTTAAAKLDSISQSLDRMIRSLESRIQMFDDLFPTNSMESLTPSPTPSASHNSPASSTTSPTTQTPTTPTPTPSSTPPSTTPTSIDATKICFPITAEPLHASPARCSTPGRSHALEASIATSTPVPTVPSVEDDLLTTTPINCSTQGHNPFNVMPYTSTTSPFAISAHVVEECPPGINTRDSIESMQCRYITKPTSASASDVPLCSAIDVHEIQEVFDVVTTQSSMVQWLPFTDSPDVMQSRLPWPPPKPLDFGDVISLLVCCTDGCVFDRGKNKIAKLAIVVTMPVMHLGSAARGKNNMGELTIAGKPSATLVDVLLVCDEMPSRLELYGTAVQVDRRMASNLSQHIWHGIFVPSAYNFHVTWMATFLLQNQHCVCVLVLVLCRQLLGYWRCWQYMLMPNIKVIQIRLQTKNIQRHVAGVSTAHFLILQVQLYFPWGVWIWHALPVNKMDRCFIELPVAEKGIVVFSFGLITFAEMYASKKWTTKATGSATCKTGFVQCCYEPIKQIITTCIHDQEDKFVGTVKADGKDLMGKTLMKRDRRTGLPASTALLEMMIFHLQISVQSQPPILCKVLLIQISFLWDQLPPFSWCLFRASNGWECHSNCRADAATFYNCTCKFDAAAADKLAYIILLTLLDGLATGYVRPCNLGNQTHTSHYVMLVLLSNRHWSGIFLHKGMSSGWYNWADNSNCMIMQLKRSGPLEINIYLVNSGVQINISPGVTMDIHITFCFPILLPWSTAEVIQIILHVQNIQHAAMGKSNSEKEKIQSKIHLPATAPFGGLVVVLGSNLYLNYGQLIELHGNRWSFCQIWRPPWPLPVHDNFKWWLTVLGNHQHRRNVFSRFPELGSDHVLAMELTLECMVAVSTSCLTGNVLTEVIPSVFLAFSTSDFANSILPWWILGLLHSQFQAAGHARCSYTPCPISSLMVIKLLIIQVSAQAFLGHATIRFHGGLSEAFLGFMVILKWTAPHGNLMANSFVLPRVSVIGPSYLASPYSRPTAVISKTVPATGPLVLIFYNLKLDDP